MLPAEGSSKDRWIGRQEGKQIGGGGVVNILTVLKGDLLFETQLLKGEL